MDVDIMDHGTPRVHDEEYGLTNLPTHTIFPPEPHSPTVTEVLPDTSWQSEESVGASSSASDAEEPEATSEPTNSAADTDAAATTTVDPKPDPPAAEAEAGAEHSTNASSEAPPDRTEDRQVT